MVHNQWMKMNILINLGNGKNESGAWIPAKGSYYHTFPDNQGRVVLRGYDPYTNDYYNPEEK